MFTVYNNNYEHKFDSDLAEKVKMLDIDDSMLTPLQSADTDAFIKIGMEYADSVIKTNEDFSDNINALFSEFMLKKSINTVTPDETLLDSYYNLYNELSN